MRNNHAFLHRTHALAGLLALALGCLSLTAHAVNKGTIGRATVSTNGRAATVTPGTNSGGSQIPVSPSIGGWTQAGNYGVPTGATGPTVGHVINGEAVVGGSAQKYPVQATYTLGRADLIAGAVGAAVGIGCLLVTGGVAAVGCALLPTALPYLYDWISRSGGRVNPQTGGLERQTEGGGYTLKWYYENLSEPYYDSAVDACRGPNRPTRSASSINDTTAQCLDGSYSVGRAFLAAVCPAAPGSGVRYGYRLRGNTPCGPAEWIPASMDDIRPYMMNTAPDGRVWGEALEKGAEFPLGNPTVTGPSSIQGPETVKQNADGTREVSKTTYNFSTSGNTITNTTNVTTTNTYNSSNVQTGTSTTTVTPTTGTVVPQEPEDACTKHPEALGCQKIDFDTPDGQIPRQSKDVSFQAENVLGGGSCPADVYSSVTSLGQTLKVWDWQATCNYFLPIRFILMALAAFSAVLIIMPGGGKSV